jgi:hypothetical protein
MTAKLTHHVTVQPNSGIVRPIAAWQASAIARLMAENPNLADLF